MNKALKLSGQRFGRLTVLRRCGSRHHKSLWKCRCDCGKRKSIISSSLTRKIRPAKSCGCLMIERTKQANTLHGFKGTSTYSCWQAMLTRCRNTNMKDYKSYGARGIYVCKQWYDFTNFLKDMGPRPSLLHQIDRIDNYGNYEPNNCRWATRLQQANNRRSNKLITFNNITLTYSEWERQLGFRSGIICKRIRRGWIFEKTLTTPPMEKFNRYKKDKEEG